MNANIEVAVRLVDVGQALYKVGSYGPVEKAIVTRVTPKQAILSNNARVERLFRGENNHTYSIPSDKWAPYSWVLETPELIEKWYDNHAREALKIINWANPEITHEILVKVVELLPFVPREYSLILKNKKS